MIKIMRTEKDFEEMTVKELFEEILQMEGGDLWDGMSSKPLQKEQKIAKNVFGKKMKAIGVEWG